MGRGVEVKERRRASAASATPLLRASSVQPSARTRRRVAAARSDPQPPSRATRSSGGLRHGHRFISVDKVVRSLPHPLVRLRAPTAATQAVKD
jgi:hypothetical protein